MSISKKQALRKLFWQRDLFAGIVIIMISITTFLLGRYSVTEDTANVTYYPPIDTAFFNQEDPVVVTDATASGAVEQTGTVVASVNSNIYHYIWCSGAKRISDKNKVYFATIAEARASGREPAKNCPNLE